MNDKLKELISQVKDFPIERYCLSDDVNIRYIYTCEFKKITSKLRIFLECLNDDYLNKKLSILNWEFSDIKEANELKIDLLSLFEYLEQFNKIKFKTSINKLGITQYQSEQIINLKDEIIELLYLESANVLPEICEGLGLASGTIGEAFESKRQYIKRRLVKLDIMEYCDVLERIRRNFPNTEITKKIEKIFELETLEVNTNFEEIFTTISQEIKQAKYIIWVAVSWITNLDLLRLLYQKQKEGVCVEIIVNDDEINNKLLKEKNIEKFLRIYKDNTSSLMHNKFCVIDLKKVITGSYNWTNKAEYNNENISMIKDRITAEEYANEFKEIKSKIIRENIIKK